MRPTGFFGLWGLVGRRAQTIQTPEQQMNSATLEREKVHEALAKQDARYDSMSEAERDKYYVNPSLLTKIKKALRGGQ